MICQQAGFSAIYALRAREADMPNCRQFFGLDKRSCPKVKVSVRNYTAIRRSLIKKHQAVDFRRDAENVLTAAPHPREDRMSSSMNSRVLLVFVIRPCIVRS